jgi:hypothetical protein
MAKMFGIGLAAAVLIDATIIRMVLDPATLELLGDRNWWLPTWLDRILPRLRVEAHDELESEGHLTGGADKKRETAGLPVRGNSESTALLWGARSPGIPTIRAGCGWCPSGCRYDQLGDRSMSAPNTPSASAVYPARLEVGYPVRSDRVKTAFRLVLILPIAIVYGLLTSGVTRTTYDASGQVVSTTSGGVAGGLFAATLLMILFRRRYPRWWFDFALELTRFGARVGAYLALLTDEYPSTDEEQEIHVAIDYPEVERDLNRWLPLVKWFLAIPHLVVLAFLSVAAVLAVVVAWFAILFTGRYPRGLFDFVVGVGRWWLRVEAYAFLLVTDRYPPFSLRP